MQILLSQAVEDTSNAVPYSGPYPQLGSLLVLYYLFTPRLYPRFFSVLGFEFSEKSLTYLFAFQVIFSGGWSGTVLPTICGAFSGFLSSTDKLPLNRMELIPEFLYKIAERIFGGIFADRGPQIVIFRNGRRNRGNGSNGTALDASMLQRQLLSSGVRAFPGIGGVQQMTPPALPSEESISQLTAMGFERDAVIQALRASDNNLEVAANRLLTGT